MRFIAALLTLAFSAISTQTTAKEKHVYEDIPYTVRQTGINYSFKFEEDIVEQQQRRWAGLHVLKSVYDDFTIKADFSHAYKKERAKCYALDSHHYTYTLCFLPHEFTREKRVLRGFVTRVPNWLWHLTNILLPVVGVFGLLFYWFSTSKKKDVAARSPSD